MNQWNTQNPRRKSFCRLSLKIWTVLALFLFQKGPRFPFWTLHKLQNLLINISQGQSLKSTTTNQKTNDVESAFLCPIGPKVTSIFSFLSSGKSPVCCYGILYGADFTGEVKKVSDCGELRDSIKHTLTRLSSLKNFTFFNKRLDKPFNLCYYRV